MLSTDIIADLKRRAAEAGADFPKLCLKSGIDYSTVWRWETGRSKPRMGMLDKIDRELRKLERRAAQ